MVIHPWENVAKGLVPTTEGFAIAEGHLRRTIITSSAIRSGLLFGSWLNGRLTRTSDLDIIIMCEKGREAEADVDLRKAFDRTTHIPVHPILMTAGDPTNLYLLDPGFLRHLLWADRNGGTIKAPMSPHLPALKDLKKSPRDDLLEYVVRKRARVRRDCIICAEFLDAEYCRHLERAIDAAAHVARKFLQVQKGEHYDSAGRTELLEGLRGIDRKMEEALSTIYAKKTLYLEELAWQDSAMLNGAPEHERELHYRAMIKQLDEAVTAFLTLTDRTLTHLF